MTAAKDWIGGVICVARQLSTYGTQRYNAASMQKKPIRWSPEKNIELMRERGISFEEILSCIEQGGLLTVLDHPNQQKYPNQRIWVAKVRAYAHLVPLVESEDEIFLKTIMPSRKATKRFLSEVGNEER